MGWAVVFLAFLSYCTGVEGQSTWTQPPSSSVPLAGTITISCLTTHSSYNIGWYQQKEGKSPRFLHCAGCNRGEGIPDRFTATKSGSTGSLAINNAQTDDEADYFCGNWNSAGNVYIFGGGTQLSISGQPTKSPTVQVFPPSREQVAGSNPYTFVCLVTGFYPPGIKVQLKRDGEPITARVEISKPSKQGSAYISSGYMSLTAAEYKNSTNFTCEVTHESKTITKTVPKSGDCELYH